MAKWTAALIISENSLSSWKCLTVLETAVWTLVHWMTGWESEGDRQLSKNNCLFSSYKCIKLPQNLWSTNDSSSVCLRGVIIWWYFWLRSAWKLLKPFLQNILFFSTLIVFNMIIIWHTQESNFSFSLNFDKPTATLCYIHTSDQTHNNHFP